MNYLIYNVICLFFISTCLCNVFKTSTEVKTKLEEYIENKKKDINQRYRPLYHVAGPVGWINDPNGFIYYKGEYHLFFQYYPYDSKAGFIHWGHVSGPDLVNWKELPTALIPEEEQCFSGSAVEDENSLVLMYTAHITLNASTYNETQYLAYSADGINFNKYEGNPVLPSAPNNSPDFRDPKVWKHEDHWYVIIGSKTSDKRGRLLLYRSTDLKDWEFLNVLGESEGRMGYMWECPDFFELDGKYILLMSPQGMQQEGDRFKNKYQTGYIIGSFSYETFVFTPEVEFQELDFGHDFYAAQTTETNGTRYLVAWFNMWEQEYPEAVDGWAGTMTIIREISLVDNRIIMKPIEAMKTIRKVSEVSTTDLKIKETIITSKATEVIIKGNFSMSVVLELKGENGNGTVYLSWIPSVGKVSVIRDGDIRQVEWTPPTSASWRLYLDASSLELFCGDGEVVFSSRAYPDGAWSITNQGIQNLELQVYELNRSVPGSSSNLKCLFSLITATLIINFGMYLKISFHI